MPIPKSKLANAQVDPVLRALGLSVDETRRDRYRGIIGEVLQSEESVADAVRALRPSKAVILKLEADLNSVASFNTQNR
jgi:hypothetical protein